MGLTQLELADIVGVDRSIISRWRTQSLQMDNKTGELALLPVRVYRALYVLFGGQREDVHHLLRTPNHHLAGELLALMGQVRGLVHMLEYPDTTRDKA